MDWYIWLGILLFIGSGLYFKWRTDTLQDSINKDLLEEIKSLREVSSTLEDRMKTLENKNK